MNATIFALILILICLGWILIWYRMLKAPVVLKIELNQGKTEISFSNGEISQENLKTLESFFIHSFKVVNGEVVQDKNDGNPPSGSGVGSASLGIEGGTISYHKGFKVFGSSDDASGESKIKSENPIVPVSIPVVEQQQNVHVQNSNEEDQEEEEEESPEYGHDYSQSVEDDVLQQELNKQALENFKEYGQLEEKRSENSDKILEEEDEEEFFNDLNEEVPSNAIRITNENKN